MNLAELVGAHGEHDRAVHDDDGWHSWGEVRRRAAATAAALARLGVGPDDRVALAWPASAGFVGTYLGILAAGAVAVPLNPADPTPAQAAELTAVQPALAIGSGPGAGGLEAAGRSIGTTVLVAEAGQGSWDDALALGDGDQPPLVPVGRRPDELAVLLFTSGTAGPAKPAMLTHGSLRANLRQLLSVPGVQAGPGDVGVCTLPLFHVFGLNVALGLSLATGSPVVLVDRFVAEEAARLVGEVEATIVVGAPAAFAHWVEVGASSSGNGRSPSPWRALRLAVAGGAPVPVELAREFEAVAGVPLEQGYGLTEASPAVATTIGARRVAAGSVGLPLPGVEVRLVDDDGESALDGDPGEIWVRGPNVFAGYWQDAAATASVLTEEGWLRTGDVGFAGPDGELFVADRRKDLIIVSGFNVFPAEVEHVLTGAPGVAEALVVGRPDPVAGEVVEAVVVPADPQHGVDETAVLAHCLQQLPRYKCPVSVRTVANLPRGVSGEALRRQLRGGATEPSR